jgi:hypothetical protein
MQCGVDLLGVVQESCSVACVLVDGEATCKTPDGSTSPDDSTATGPAIWTPNASTAVTTTTQEVSEPPPVVIDPNNLFADPSFESGKGDWTTLGGAVLVPTASSSHTGEHSLLCAGRTETWEGPAIEALPLVERGKTYVVSGWVRLNGGTSAGLTIVRKAACLSDAGVAETDQSVIYGPLGSDLVRNDRWSQVVSTSFTVPDCELSTFLISFEGPRPGESFYLDDVSLTPYE